MPASGLLDWRKALSSRKGAKPGAIRRAGSSKAALLDAVAMQDVATNPDEWSASAIISTPTPDRSDDIVHPGGCMLENYKRNPVVFYDHQFSGIMFPVGLSEDKAGNFTVLVTDQNVQATTYFDKEIEESRQIFKLIQAKFLRTTSIGFDPVEVQLRQGFHVDQFGNGPLEVFKWELLEYSWVGIPCNPEATRKLLDIRRIDDEPISELFLKSFAPYAAPIPVQGRGWTPPEKKTVAKTKSDPMVEDEDLNKPDETLADDTPVDSTVPAEEPPADDSTKDPADQPLGMQVMGAVATALGGLIAQVNSAMGPVEQPDIKEHLGKLAEMLGGCLAESTAAYTAAYPDGGDLQPSDPEADTSVEKFLAGNQASRLQAAGLAHTLKQLAGDKNLTAGQKLKLKSVAGSLGKIVDVAKKSVPAKADPHAAELAELLTETKQLVNRFKELAPVPTA